VPPRHHKDQTRTRPADSCSPSVPDRHPHVVTLNAAEHAVTSLTITYATAAQVAAWPLGNREPAALGSRRHLRRRPLPSPLRQRTSRHGHPTQLRNQRAPARRPRQHRKSVAQQRPKPSQTRQTTTEQVKWTLPRPWPRSPVVRRHSPLFRPRNYWCPSSRALQMWLHSTDIR